MDAIELHATGGRTYSRWDIEAVRDREHKRLVKLAATIEVSKTGAPPGEVETQDEIAHRIMAKRYPAMMPYLFRIWGFDHVELPQVRRRSLPAVAIEELATVEVRIVMYANTADRDCISTAERKEAKRVLLNLSNEAHIVSSAFDRYLAPASGPARA